jgi:hypothetical protein
MTRSKNIKGLVAVCHSFCLFLYCITFIQYNHPITFIQYIRRGLSPSPHRLWLSGKDLPVVPSRESNSGRESNKNIKKILKLENTQQVTSRVCLFMYMMCLKHLYSISKLNTWSSTLVLQTHQYF